MGTLRAPSTRTPAHLVWCTPLRFVHEGSLDGRTQGGRKPRLQMRDLSPRIEEDAELTSVTEQEVLHGELRDV